MMNSKKLKIYSLVVVFFAILIAGCMKDSGSVSVPEFESSAELLTYIELNRNVMDVDNYSPVVDVDEVYGNLGAYLIIDIREKSLFVEGHIQGAKNILPEDLMTYLKDADLSTFPKIIIVGATGQDGAYVTCLLRLAGYENVYYLNYGMGYWNKAFSAQWTKGRGNYSARYFNSYSYAKKSFNALPDLAFTDANTIKEKVESRINTCLKKGYDAVKTNVKDTYTNYFRYDEYDFSGCCFICYGPAFIYKGATGYLGRLLGHPAGSIYYDPSTDFKSTTNLQTIPSNMPVIVLSLNGQDGAYIVAYLQFLGYDARNIDFGTWSIWGLNNFILKAEATEKYPFTIYANNFTPYGYWVSDTYTLGVNTVREYPYVTGE